MRTLRAFVGLPVGRDVVRATAALASRLRLRLRRDGVHGKWVPPHNFHLTLRFLGDITEPQVAEVREALGRVPSRRRGVAVRFRGLGAFPDPARPAVLWLGLTDGAAAVSDLAAEVAGLLAPLGFPEEDRPFHPHLTLARFRRDAPPPDLAACLAEFADADAGEAVLRDLVLFDSSPRPRGPVYVPIWRGDLGAPPGGAAPLPDGEGGPDPAP